MFRTFILIWPVLLTSFTYAGEVYKCTVDGKVAYSQMPCGDKGTEERLHQLEVIQTIEKLPSIETNAVTNHNKANGVDDQRQVKIHIINNKIKRSYKEIDRYRTKMRRELKTIKDKTYYASNNNAGSNYLNALSNEMSAVSEKYKIYIDMEKDTIQSYKDEMMMLKQN